MEAYKQEFIEFMLVTILRVSETIENVEFKPFSRHLYFLQTYRNLS